MKTFFDVMIDTVNRGREVTFRYVDAADATQIIIRDYTQQPLKQIVTTVVQESEKAYILAIEQMNHKLSKR